MASETPEKRRPGAPSKCTPEVQRRIVSAIVRGAGREDAARAAGVCRATLQRWLAEGARAESGVYRDFLDAVEGAESRLIRRASKVITDLLAPETAESVRFASAKFILERRAPHLWGSKAAFSLSGPDGGPLQHHVEAKVAPMFTDEQLANMSPEQMVAAMRETAKIAKGGEP